MQVLKSEEDLGCEEAGLILVELSLVPHDVEQLPPLNVVDEHVDLRSTAECEV
jgi:hypothetical protein